MRILFIILILFGMCGFAQTDKIYLVNGEVKKGLVISMGNDFVFSKSSDTSLTTKKYLKSDILLIEKYDGKVFVFGKNSEKKVNTIDTTEVFYRNSLGIQPLSFFLGRVSLVYERMNKEGTIGFALPVSLTFDPTGIIYEPDSSRGTSGNHLSGVNFIGGADVNFYVGKGDFEGFYLGPRVRYGVDMFIGNIEAYTVQTQFGWKLEGSEYRMSHHISVGFGFVRILSSQAGNRINSKNSYSWGSISYRIGLNW